MNKYLRKKQSLTIFVVVIVLGLGYLLARPHLNRLLDNRDRATMTKQVLNMERQIQIAARAKGSYPSESDVKVIVSHYFSPHTNKPYELISSVTNYSQVKDSQVAYGYGGSDENCFEGVNDNKKAHLVSSIDLVRVHEGSVGCDVLTLNGSTDKMLNYKLSCKTNWLGFKTSCDASLLK